MKIQICRFVYSILIGGRIWTLDENLMNPPTNYYCYLIVKKKYKEVESVVLHCLFGKFSVYRRMYYNKLLWFLVIAQVHGP